MMEMDTQRSTDVYEIRSRRDRRGIDLISDVLPFGRLWYAEPNAISPRQIFQPLTSCGRIRVYDEAGTVIETHEQTGDFKEP
jgi:hypothetical protein